MTKALLCIAILCFVASTTGCASLLLGAPSIGDFNLPSLLLELNMTLEALEETSIPVDASEADIATFLAVQAARRAFVLQLIEAIEARDPTIDLSRYRAAIAAPETINGA